MSEFLVKLGGFSRPKLGLTVRLYDAHGAYDRLIIKSGNHFIDSDEVVAIDVIPNDQGYWGRHLDEWDDEEIISLEPIAQDGPYGWWHRYHQIDGDDICGKGMRIGVIDDFLKPAVAQEMGITVVPPEEYFSADLPNGDLNGFTDHGEKVVSMIGARNCGAHGFDGTAKNAEIFYACGRDWLGPDGDYVESDEYLVELAPQVVANAIRCLSEKYRCQIITISAGRLENVPEIHNEIRAAQLLGTVVFAGAGNDAVPFYPAAYRECVSVSALGMYGSAPEGSVERCEEEYAEPCSEEGYYRWLRSGTRFERDLNRDGAAPELMAAGVNVISSRNARAAFPCTGTSFASPIAAGVCATILANLDETDVSTDELWNHRCSNLLSFCDIVGVRDSTVAVPKARRSKVVMNGRS